MKKITLSFQLIGRDHRGDDSTTLRRHGNRGAVRDADVESRNEDRGVYRLGNDNNDDHRG